MLRAHCTALCALQLKEDGNGNVKILSSNAGKEFAAEEISAQVLRKLVDDAGKFLNDKVAPQHACTSCSGRCSGPQAKMC
jgi:molecular chaperone DnaK (HSP70)